MLTRLDAFSCFITTSLSIVRSVGLTVAFDYIELLLAVTLKINLLDLLKRAEFSY